MFFDEKCVKFIRFWKVSIYLINKSHNKKVINKDFKELNQMILQERFCFSYMSFSFVLIKWFIICYGWLDEVLTYSNWSFGFLYGFYVPFNKLYVIFEQKTICKFVLILILKPAFLKISIMYFLFGLFSVRYISQKYRSIIPIHTSRFFIKFIWQ